MGETDLSSDGDVAREEPEYLNVLNNPEFEVVYEQPEARL